MAGASGVLIGTRFVATKEAASHDEYKSAVTRAKAADTVLTVCFQDGWPNAPHRALRNRTFEMWEAVAARPPGNVPARATFSARTPSLALQNAVTRRSLPSGTIEAPLRR